MWDGYGEAVKQCTSVCVRLMAGQKFITRAVMRRKGAVVAQTWQPECPQRWDVP